MARFDCVEKPLSHWFRRYGDFVARHAKQFILIPLLVTAFCCVGFLHLKVESEAIFLYTPTNGRSKYERGIIHETWPLEYNNYIPGRAVTQSREIQMTLTATGDQNILEHKFVGIIAQYQRLLEQELSVRFDGKNYTYQDLCLTFRNEGCPGTTHIQAISELYNHGFNISYPTFRLGDKSGYIGSTLGGVSLFKGDDGKDYVYKAKSWLMVYHLKFYPKQTSYVSGLWEMEFQKVMMEAKFSEDIVATVYHSQTLTEELKRNGKHLVPKFAVAFVLLCTFAVLCSISFVNFGWYIDWTISKPIPVFVGVVSAGMGIVSSIGFLSFCGLYYNDIVGVMPFLVLAVGTDNAFLILAGVRRTSRLAPIPKRISETMSEAGVSMFITSLTNVLSFAIGAITTIPAVQIFCIYTSLALLFTFIYSITIYTAVLALFLERERDAGHCLFLGQIWQVLDQKHYEDANWFNKCLFLGSSKVINVTPRREFTKPSMIVNFFKCYFGPILNDGCVQLFVLVGYIVYVLIAVRGCLDLREGLEPVNLLVQDSYAIGHYRNLETNFLKYGPVVQIVVNNPPDLRLLENRRRMKEMVKTFADCQFGIGLESAQFWMFEAESFLVRNNISLGDIQNKDYYQMVMNYFMAKPSERWSEDVAWTVDKNQHMKMKTFRFLVGMKDISSTSGQTKATATMRKVADGFKQYNVTTFMPLWLFTDQYALVVPNTVQNIIIALICMIFIAVLLIPEPVCALVVAFAIASVDLGVIGYMTIWGVNLDAISMITIIMSIGFSVDYSAHLTYGYVISAHTKPADKVIEAVESLGLPLLQGAMSTILAVVVLVDTPAYMVQTFFKTVFLSITFGLLHGLVFLPVTLSVFIRPWCLSKDGETTTYDITKPGEEETNFSIPPHQQISRIVPLDTTPLGRPKTKEDITASRKVLNMDS